MQSLEIETKYNADGISLTEFHVFCKERQPKSYLFASGFDHFFQKKTDPDAFCRHRTGPDINQLTFKRKHTAGNNFIRTEHNLDMQPNASQELVTKLCGEFGYEYNTSLFKTCFIYRFQEYTLVYYICFDPEMKELGRFVEIEMSEEHRWTCQDDAWRSLQVIEKLCKPLGLATQKRVKRCLYEMYRKETY